MTGWLTVGLIDCWTHWVAVCLFFWLIDWLTEWLLDCLTNWLSDWLSEWLAQSTWALCQLWVSQTLVSPSVVQRQSPQAAVNRGVPTLPHLFPLHGLVKEVWRREAVLRTSSFWNPGSKWCGVTATLTDIGLDLCPITFDVQSLWL